MDDQEGGAAGTMAKWRAEVCVLLVVMRCGCGMRVFLRQNQFLLVCTGQAVHDQDQHGQYEGGEAHGDVKIARRMNIVETHDCGSQIYTRFDRRDARLCVSK